MARVRPLCAPRTHAETDPDLLALQREVHSAAWCCGAVVMARTQEKESLLALPLSPPKGGDASGV